MSESNNRQWLIGGALAIWFGLLSGCQSMQSMSKIPMPWSGDEVIASKYKPPQRMAAIWTDATYNSAGKRSVRGFGGRIYFYGQDSSPIPVEGQLVVYAFDDSDLNGPAQRPSRKFVFTPEQFTERFSESDLGASYSVWLPWDQIGGEAKSISLLPIFTASNGQVITGAQSINLLPGAKKQPERFFSRVQPESAGARPSMSKVQPAAYAERGLPQPTVAAYQTEVDRESSQTMARMETTTIKPRGHLAAQILNQSQQISNQSATRRPTARSVENVSAGPPANFSRRPGDSYRSYGRELRSAELRTSGS